MSYLLYFKEKIVGCFNTPELLRTNILILIFELLEKNKINELVYEDIYNYLTNISFNISTFDIQDLKNNLQNLDFHIEKIKCENNGKIALNNIKEHIKYRFDKLNDIMDKNLMIKCTIPGENYKKHNLGTMYKEQWKIIDKNYEELYKELYSYISLEIKNLIKKYKSRVQFGDVRYDKMNPFSYQIWSANAINWNLKEGSEIPGKFQAEEIKYQEEGSFGICVFPTFGYDLKKLIIN